MSRSDDKKANHDTPSKLIGKKRKLVKSIPVAGVKPDLVEAKNVSMMGWSIRLSLIIRIELLAGD